MTHCVEVGVAALCNCPAHVDGPVSAEAAEKAISQSIAARTMDPLRRINAVLKKRKRVHGLDRRAWRIERVEHLVDQRTAQILGESSPLRPTNAVRKAV